VPSVNSLGQFRADHVRTIPWASSARRICSAATWSGISFPTHRLPSSLSFFPSLRDRDHLVKGTLLRMEVAILILVVKPQSLSIQEFLSGIYRDGTPPRNGDAGCSGSASYLPSTGCPPAGSKPRRCRQPGLPPAHRPKQRAPRKEGDGERKPGKSLANSKHKSEADHAHLPMCIFSHAFPKSPAPPCCTHSFDLQTLSSSPSNAVGRIPLSCSTFKVPEHRAETPPELHTPCGSKGRL